MREVIEKPASLTGERWEEIKHEADYLEGSMGWNFLRGYDLTTAESDFIWDYVFHELGVDSCDSCGYYTQANEMWYGQCDECRDAEEEE